MRRIFIFLTFFLMVSFYFLFGKNALNTVTYIVDGSGSMKGYFSGEDAGAAYHKLLLKIDESVSELFGGEVQILKVGAEIKYLEYKSIMCAGNTNFYNEKRSNFFDLIDKIAKDKIPFAVFITDSELNLKERARKYGCIEGYDVTCLERRLRKLLKSGEYYLSILGVKVPFGGNLFLPGGKKINLKKTIYKPVYFYFFYKKDISTSVSKLLEKIKNYLRNFRLPRGKRAIEFKIANVYFPDVIFPRVKLDLKEIGEKICTKNGDEIYGPNKKCDYREKKGKLMLSFYKVKDLSPNAYAVYNIPFEVVGDGKIFEMVIKPRWENINGKDLGNGSGIFKKGKGIEIVWEKGYVGQRGKIILEFNKYLTSINSSTSFKLFLNLYFRLKENVSFFKDWSVDFLNGKDALKKYLNGATPYISNLLGSLYRSCVWNIKTGRKEEEKKIFTIEMEFEN